MKDSTIKYSAKHPLVSSYSYLTLEIVFEAVHPQE